MAKPSATERARRLLAILHVFEPGTEVALSDVAEALGTDVDTVASDLEMLSCCGVAPYEADGLVPLYVENGVVTVFGELPALDEPVRLSAREASALFSALQAAGMSATDPLPKKLLAAAGTDVDAAAIERQLRAAVAPGAGYTLGPLMFAQQQCRVVRIEYRAYGRLTETERTLEPMSLLQERGAWYVRGLVRETGKVQTFRVDRIRNARLTTETFAPCPPPAADTAPDSSLSTEGLPVATVRLNTAEDYSERDWPGAWVTSIHEDGITLAVPYAGTAWVARQVAARLGGAEVLDPAELREAVAELAREELARL